MFSSFSTDGTTDRQTRSTSRDTSPKIKLSKSAEQLLYGPVLVCLPMGVVDLSCRTWTRIRIEVRFYKKV